MKKITICILVILSIASCRKKQAQTSWDADITTPLAYTDLNLANLVSDSIISTNPDNTLQLNYRTSLYEFNLADQFIKIPDTSIFQNYSINQINLGNIHINYKASLGSMADVMVNSGNSSQVFFGNFIKNNHGNTVNIPALTGLQPAPFQFDASQFFTQLTVSSAKIEFWLVNKFPVDITNVSFELRNTNSNTLLFSDNINLIRAKDSAYYSHIITNVNLENNITFKVTNISTPGTNGVPTLIDTNDYIDLHGGISQIQVTEAIAKFPAQELVGSDAEITQEIGDRKFTYVDCRTGQLIVNIKSSIQETVRLKYQLKGAYDKFGNPLIKETTIPAATGTQQSSISESFNLDGFSIGLTGSDGSKFNTYTQIISAKIDSTGIERHISNKDSLYFEYKLINIKPNYIKGYAGVDTLTFQGNSPFDFINMFSQSAPNALQFENIALNLQVENGLGLEGDVTINQFSGTNANGNVVNLQNTSSTGVIGNTIRVLPATDFPYTPHQQTISVNSSNSNINSFLSNLPTSISYNMFLKTNPRGNLQTYDNFAYLESRMKVNLDLQIPLSTIANNLILRDSINFSLGNTTDEIDNILDGNLYIHAYNKYPIEAAFTFIVYDEQWNELDTLVASKIIEAAPLNNNCRADVEKKSLLTVPLNAATKEKIKSAKHAVVLAKFNTRPNATCNGQFIKIYSDYHLKVKVGAQFNYKVKL